MKLIPALLLVSICLSACNKKDAMPTIDFGPNGGITSRDATGNPQGSPDPTDWTNDINWNKQELELFDSPFDLNAPYTARTRSRGFYPNPTAVGAGGNFGLYDIPSNATLEMVFVDKQYRVVDRSTVGAFLFTDISLQFNLPASKFSPNSTYRAYYIVYSLSPATLYLKGHGDIKISQ